MPAKKILNTLYPSKKLVRLAFSSQFSNDGRVSTDLKEVLANRIIKHQKNVADFRSQHNNTVIGKITVNTVYSGMRSMKGLICETSALDPEEGIRFRGYSLSECQKLIYESTNEEPTPEAMWWLLCTGDIPTADQVKRISREWTSRVNIPYHVVNTLGRLPKNIHPMTQFAIVLAALNVENAFGKAYINGAHPSTYWEHIYEDANNLLANLPIVAAMIYQNLYRGGPKSNWQINSGNDWSSNFATLLGCDTADFVKYLRLYLVIHCDHEGGNVSAHTSHLVGSSLADPFLCLSAAMCGLAGPLHGLACQEVLTFLTRIIDDLSLNYSENDLEHWLLNHLKTGQVIPGYGHAVLRKTDPRFECQRQFALKHLPKNPMCKLVSDLYKIVPGLLLEQGKAKNPWPNIDAHSGVLLQHYGIKEMNFSTVMVGVSRALGCLSQLIWDRAMKMPLERPKSMSTEGMKKFVSENKR